MPELPEVETIRKTLTPHVVGKTIEKVEVRSPEFVVGASPAELRRAVEGARVVGLDRKGKFLVFRLDRPSGGPDVSGAAGRPDRATPPDPPEPQSVLLVHLKMAGALVYCEPGADFGPTRQKHIHVVFRLDDGNELRYIDTRHFGRLYLVPDRLAGAGDPAGPAGPDGRTSRAREADPVLEGVLRTFASLGPEPREGGLEWPAFRDKLARRDARIKPLLLDQSFVAGLGNIYADECLFRAGIHPLRRASSLSEEEARALFGAMREVIGEAIDSQGTSIRDYVDGEGRRGSFAEKLNVYGRTGEACPKCGTKVERAIVAGRGTHFCPRCQPPPEAR